MIISLVVLTLVSLKVIVSDARFPGVSATSAACVDDDISSPIVLINGEVVTVDPGLVTSVIMTMKSETRDVLAKALLTTMVTLSIAHE